jgi:nucleotide-binding universal stress UspA family protein
MYDRILVPLDGSTVAEQVLPHVIRLAEKFGSDVTLMKSIRPQIMIYPIAALTGWEPFEITVEAKHDLADEIVVAKHYLIRVGILLQRLGINCAGHISEGDPASRILQYSIDGEFSLITMAAPRRPRTVRVALGSVADTVCRRSEVPVLLVRARA